MHPSPRVRDLLAVLLLALLPAILLGDSVFGGRKHVPYDLAEFLPAAADLTPEQLAELRDGANYDPTEPPIWFLPELELARRAVAAGQYPHWNAYCRGGAPLTASGILGLLDPLHWPALLFADARDGALCITWVLFALAGVLLYGLARELQLGRSAALFAAIAFEWSGTLVANGHWYMRLEPLALLPGMLWALLAIARGDGWRRGRAAVLFALPMALSWSACFPPFAIPCTLLCGLLALLLTITSGRRDGARAAAGLLAWFALAFALGLLLASATIAQQVLFFPVSNRPVAPSMASIGRFAFDPMGLLGYLFPAVFSHPSDRLMNSGNSPLAFLLFSRVDWETGQLLRPDRNYNFSEYAVFAGTLPLLLAGLGLLTRGPRWRLLAGAAIALLLLLAIGLGPIRFAYLLPGIQTVPPYRFAGPACAFVALLAGLGFDHLCRADGRRRTAITGGLSLLLGVGLLLQAAASRNEGPAQDARWLQTITDRYRPLASSFDPALTESMVTADLVRRALFSGEQDGQRVDLLAHGRLRLEQNLDRSGFAFALAGAALLFFALRPRGRTLSPWLAAAAVVITGAELWSHGRTLNRGRECRIPTDTVVHEYLRARRDELAAQGGFTFARASRSGGADLAFPPGPPALDRLRDLQFYSYVDRHSSAPFRALYGDGFLMRDYLPTQLLDDARLQLPYWDAIGLRFVLSTQPLQFAGVQVGPAVSGRNGRFFVYERATALPRAFVVPALRTVADDDAMVAAAIAPDFAPRDHALVTAAERALLPELPAAPAARSRRVTFAFEDQKRVTLDVEAGPAGFLVLADTHLPGWTVQVDGNDVPMARGNVWQRVVAVPAGACRVAYRYRTPGLVSGVALSTAAVSFCTVLLWLARRSTRRPTAAAADPDPPHALDPHP